MTMKTGEVKPIETNYAGCMFRSRLEARWALFFTTLGITWEYEPEGFDLPSGRYLPDFKVNMGHPKGPIWWEVKHAPDNDQMPDIDPRWRELWEATGQNVNVSFGMHRMPERPTKQHSLFDPPVQSEGAEGPFVPSRIRTTSPFHQPRDLTEAQREKFRKMSRESREARRSALAGEGPAPLHEINVPKFQPLDLMPQRDGQGLRALSLFSGGGGLDLGVERAGFTHTASFEIMPEAGDTLRKARSDWAVFSGEKDGDVRRANFKQWRGEVELLHGGPPCQPFSNAGRQQGHLDERDMWPQFVRAVKEIHPAAFIGENVPALASPKFSQYVSENILAPLSGSYHIQRVTLQASDFGVPQVRRRVFFVGFRTEKMANAWTPPEATHYWGDAAITGGTRCMGLREALGLPDNGFDDLSPTIRSSLTGPRHTTSILNSVAAQRKFESLGIWPNGVAADRTSARAFVAKNGHFRLSVQDVALIQGFPEDWPFVGATYMALGQIGNAVPPPLGYAVASSVLQALSK